MHNLGWSLPPVVSPRHGGSSFSVWKVTEGHELSPSRLLSGAFSSTLKISILSKKGSLALGYFLYFLWAQILSPK